MKRRPDEVRTPDATTSNTPPAQGSAAVPADLYGALLRATLALYPAARTTVRVVRAPIADEAPWAVSEDGSVLVLDAAMDARLQPAMDGGGGLEAPSIERAARAVQTRLDIHHIVRALLGTMDSAEPAASAPPPPRERAGHSSLLVGLADFLAAADLDRIASAAGVLPGDSHALYTAGVEHRAVAPLVRAAAQQLLEDPVVLARRLFSEGPLDEGLLHMARQLTRTTAPDAERSMDRLTSASVLLETVMAPLAAAERMSADAHLHPEGRGDGTPWDGSTEPLYQRAAFAEAGRLAVEALQNGSRRESWRRGGGGLPPPASLARAPELTAAMWSRSRRPSSRDELITAAGLATRRMLGGTCKARSVEAGYAGLYVPENTVGGYFPDSRMIGIDRTVFEHLDHFIRFGRTNSSSLEDRLDHCGRAGVVASCAGVLLHEFLHATDVRGWKAHAREHFSTSSWQFAVREAITELTTEALLPEFLVRTGLAAIDPVLLEVAPQRSYTRQTSAFEPIAQQVADWLGMPLRDELVALKRAGGAEESMALLADQVTFVLGIGGDRGFCRDIARPAIRELVQGAMGALQVSLDTLPAYILSGDPFGGLLVQQLRDTATALVQERSRSTPPAASRWVRRRSERATARRRTSNDQARPPEQGRSLEL